MDNIYTVKITSQAEEQIQETIYYITHELKAPDAALHLLDTLENSITSLSHYSKGIRRLPVKNFLIYFWIDDANMNVQVIALIYGKRDQLHQLSQMNME